MTNNRQTFALSNQMRLTYEQDDTLQGLTLSVYIGPELPQNNLGACTQESVKNYVAEAYFLMRAKDLGLDMQIFDSRHVSAYELQGTLDEAGFMGCLQKLNGLFAFIDFETLRAVKAQVLEELKQTQKQLEKAFNAEFLADGLAVNLQKAAFMTKTVQELTLQDIQDLIGALYVPQNIELAVAGPKALETLRPLVRDFKI